MNLILIAVLVWSLYYLINRGIIYLQLLRAERQANLATVSERLRPLNREERLKALPQIWVPDYFVSQQRGTVARADIGNKTNFELLDLFERHLLASAEPEVFLAHFKPDPRTDDHCVSIVIGFHTHYRVRIVGWIALGNRGPNIEWNLMATEARMLHNIPGITEKQRKWSIPDTSQWFSTFILENWSAAIDEAMESAMAGRSTVINRSNPQRPTDSRRPQRRD